MSPFFRISGFSFFCRTYSQSVAKHVYSGSNWWAKNHHPFMSSCVRSRFQSVFNKLNCITYARHFIYMAAEKTAKRFMKKAPASKQKSQKFVTKLHLYGVILCRLYATACVKTICIVGIRRHSNNRTSKKVTVVRATEKKTITPFVNKQMTHKNFVKISRTKYPITI